MNDKLVEITDKINALMDEYINLVKDMAKEDCDERVTLCVTAIKIPQYGTWMKVVRDYPKRE